MKEAGYYRRKALRDLRAFDKKCKKEREDLIWQKLVGMKQSVTVIGDNKQMKRQELLKLHQVICDDARLLMERKNTDYAGGEDSPFANFKAGAILGVKPEIGLLMRCMDKFQRLKAFINTGDLAVKSESATDAIIDVINYMVLLKGMFEEQEEK